MNTMLSIFVKLCILLGCITVASLIFLIGVGIVLMINHFKDF